MPARPHLAHANSREATLRAREGKTGSAQLGWERERDGKIKEGGAERRRGGGREEEEERKHQATNLCLLEPFTLLCKIEQHRGFPALNNAHIYIYIDR